MKLEVYHGQVGAAVLQPAPASFGPDLANVSLRPQPARKEADPVGRYPLLDLIRGAAAVAVAGCHWRNLFFQDFEQVGSPGVLCKAFYLLSGLGHQAVVVFFVLSGFVICNSIHASLRKATWSWRGYLVARLSRLWVVLIPAILLGVFFDRLGFSTLESGGIYRCAGFGHILQGTEPDQFSLKVVFGNLLFLQTILVPTLGSNGPLWSLANEFWYYVVFPLFLMAFRGPHSTRVRIAQALVGLAVLAATGPGISSYFSIWLLGCAVFYLVSAASIQSQKTAFGICLGGGLMTLALLMAYRTHRLDALGTFGQDFILGLTIACTIFGAAKLKPLSSSSFWVKTSVALAKPSYSLYLLHLPFLVFVASRLFRSNSDRWAPDLRHVAYGLAIAACCGLYVLALYFLTEAKTESVRRCVSRWFRPARRGAVQLT